MTLTIVPEILIPQLYTERQNFEKMETFSLLLSFSIILSFIFFMETFSHFHFSAPFRMSSRHF
jgi:hypothetical protein